MKRALLVVVLTALPAMGDEVPRITLDQALRLALANHPAIAASRSDVAAKTAAIAAARAPFDTALEASLDLAFSRRPSPERADGQVLDSAIGASVGYVHRLEWGTAVGVSLSHRYADSAGVLTVLAPQFTTDLRATASQPLLRGAGSSVNLASIGAAQTLEKAAQLDAERTLDEVLAEVAVRYWIAAQAEEEVVIRQRALERAERVEQLTTELIQRGSLPQAAQVQARSTALLRRARLEAADRIREEARSSLMRAILDRVPARVATQASVPAPAAPPIATPEAALARADVRAAELRASALEQQTALAEDRTRPALDLSLFLGLSGLGGTQNAIACQLFAQPGAPPPAGCVANGELDGYGKTWSTLFGGGYYTAGLGATLLLPISDEGARGQAQLARIAVDRARLGADSLRREAAADIHALTTLVISDRRAFEAAEQARTVTLQLIDIEEQRYKVGSATTFDVLRAQDDLAEAESLASTARAAVLTTDVRFQLAAGAVLKHLGIHSE